MAGTGEKRGRGGGSSEGGASRSRSLAQQNRIDEAARRSVHWRRWGPYLSERQWGTVREDYSRDGAAWDYLTHDHARSRAYRWGEDGVGGICDNHQRLCFASLCGMAAIRFSRSGCSGSGSRREPRRGREGVLLLSRLHSNPLLHEVPLQVSAGAYPYALLVDENRRRGREPSRSSSCSTRVYSTAIATSTCFVEYAKATHEDVLIRITAINRGPEPASSTCYPRFGTATPGRGATSRAGRACVTARRAPISRPSRPSTRRSASAGSMSAAHPSCSSPRTRRTSSASRRADDRAAAT